MLFPSKVISYSESILPKFPLILRYLDSGPKKIRDVYRHAKNEVSGIEELFEVLDGLYALGRIDLKDDEIVIVETGEN